MQDQVIATPTPHRRVPWNKGKLTGAKPPLRPKHVWSIRTKLQIEGRVRDLAMFNLAIDSKLRGCHVAIRVEDVAASGYTADRATVRQKKTGRPVRFELSEQTRQAIDNYLQAANKRPGEFLFTGRRGPETSMTTRHYARLVSDWIGSVGLDPRLFGTHSLRRTKATLIYRRNGNLRAVQLLLGHTNRPAFDAARRAILIGEEPRMQTNLQDRMDIADLMTGWIHRDLAQWNDLRTLFHPDGEIEVTWFEGKASDFVDASMRMAHRICGRNTPSRRRWWRSAAARQSSKPTW